MKRTATDCLARLIKERSFAPLEVLERTNRRTISRSSNAQNLHSARRYDAGYGQEGDFHPTSGSFPPMVLRQDYATSMLVAVRAM